jgi:hypothetical protein
MTDTIAFYHNPQSRGRIAHWMLEEVNAPYEINVVDFDKREHKSADFLAINPIGRCVRGLSDRLGFRNESYRTAPGIHRVPQARERPSGLPARQCAERRAGEGR